MFGAKKGFTLIELLIVVAIIAILAAIAIPNFLEAQTRSKVSRIKSDMRTNSLALESFYIDHNWYPPDGLWPTNTFTPTPWIDNNCKPWFSTPDAAAGFNFWCFSNCLFLTTPVAYMTSIPKDPFVEKGSWLEGSLFYGNFQDRWKMWVAMDPSAQPPKIDASQGANDIDGRKTFWWILESVGPDFIANAHMNPPNKDYVQYDPSNGTISKGDIFRVGP